MGKGLFGTFWGEFCFNYPTIQERARVVYAEEKTYRHKFFLGVEPSFDGICLLQSIKIIPEANSALIKILATTSSQTFLCSVCMKMAVQISTVLPQVISCIGNPQTASQLHQNPERDG